MCIYHEFHTVKQGKRAFNRILSTRNLCCFGLLLEFTQSCQKPQGFINYPKTLLCHCCTDTALARTILHARVVQIENENQIRLKKENKFMSIITITWTNYVHIQNQIRGSFHRHQGHGRTMKVKKYLPILWKLFKITEVFRVESTSRSQPRVLLSQIMANASISRNFPFPLVDGSINNFGSGKFFRQIMFFFEIYKFFDEVLSRTFNSIHNHVFKCIQGPTEDFL